MPKYVIKFKEVVHYRVEVECRDTELPGIVEDIVQLADFNAQEDVDYVEERDWTGIYNLTNGTEVTDQDLMRLDAKEEP